VRRVESNTRRSAAYFPGIEQTDPFIRVQGRAFLLARDLPIGVTPYHEGDVDAFKAVLVPPVDDKTRNLVRKLLTSEHHHGFTDAVSAFIRETTEALAYSGELFYEIVESERDVEQEASGSGWQLAMLPPGKVLRCGAGCVQVIPDYARAELGRKAVWLPRRKVWRVAFPRKLIGARAYRRLLTRLAHLSDVTPEFVLTPALGADVEGYDFQTYHRASDAAVEHVTRRFGSIPSLLQIEPSTEFYYFDRTLQFRYAQALIREHLVDQFNVLLKRLEIASTVRLEGLPTSAEIATLRRQLTRGEIDFAAAAAGSRAG
jgi:hypothetical protein